VAYIAGTEGASYDNNHVNYGSLYIVAIKIRMGYGGPWVNTLAYVDDVNINDYFETFDQIQQVIPEVPLGAVLAGASMLAAFGVYLGLRRRKPTIAFP
jgi:hypothetical protein